jgi:hypothetical protein
MSKAEEKLQKWYPTLAEEYAFIEGYEQAEKDLALTIEDIKTIDRLLNKCVDCSNPYQEVLNRFNKQKGT